VYKKESFVNLTINRESYMRKKAY